MKIIVAACMLCLVAFPSFAHDLSFYHLHGDEAKRMQEHCERNGCPVNAHVPTDPRVTDGDSLKINGVRIRMSRIDAVEHDQICYEDELTQHPWECGKAATRFMSDIIRHRGVKCNDEGRDYYGRTLATCYAGETNLNAEMVRLGFAITMGKDGYWDEWDHASRHRLGIHKGPFMKPSMWRKTRKGTNR